MVRDDDEPEEDEPEEDDSAPAAAFFSTPATATGIVEVLQGRSVRGRRFGCSGGRAVGGARAQGRGSSRSRVMCSRYREMN